MRCPGRQGEAFWKGGQVGAGACAGKKGGRVELAEGRRPRGLAGGGARAGSTVFWKAPEAGLRLPKRPKGLRRVQAGRTASARAWEGHSPSVGRRAAQGRRGPRGVRGEGTWARPAAPSWPSRGEGAPGAGPPPGLPAVSRGTEASGAGAGTWGCGACGGQAGQWLQGAPRAPQLAFRVGAGAQQPQGLRPLHAPCDHSCVASTPSCEQTWGRVCPEKWGPAGGPKVRSRGPCSPGG